MAWQHELPGRGARDKTRVAIEANVQVLGAFIGGVRSHMLFVLDATGVIRTWNAGATRVAGYEPDEAVGRHYATLFPDRDQMDGLPALMLEAARRDGFHHHEGLRVRKEGSQYWVDETITREPGPRPETCGFIVIGQDVTQRKRAEKALRERGERLDLLLQEVKGYALFVLDRRGVIIEWSGDVAGLTGFAGEEIVGRHVATLYPPERIAEGAPAHELELAATGGRFEGYALCRRKDESQFWADTAIVALYNGRGKLRGFKVVLRDISERVRGETALNDANTCLAALQATTSDAMLTFTDTGIILSASPMVEPVFGYDSKEIVYRNIQMLLPPPGAGGHKTLLQHLKAASSDSEMPAVRVYSGLDKSGATFPLAMRISHANLDDRRIFVAACSNLVAERRAEERIKEVSRALDRTEESRSRFLSTVSHELRTPLNAVIGFAELISKSPLAESRPEKSREYAQDILDSAKQLLAQIDALLDAAQIEHGRTRGDGEPVSMEGVLEEIWDLVRDRAETKKVALSRVIAPVNPVVHGDRQSLRQILVNLLSNAIRFSEENGQVSIEVQPDSRGRLAIAVGENGATGIGENHTESVFNPYVRVDGAGAEDMGSAELGLAIVSGLVEMLDGEIRVDRNPGGGATFTVILPAARWSFSHG